MIAAVLALWAESRPNAPKETQAPTAVSRAFADRAFLGGLWLNTLPALLFGIVVVLVPLQLDAGGFAPLAIGAVFLVAGLLEAGVNPLIGRISDRRGRLFPVRIGLAASIAVALAFASRAIRTRWRSLQCSPRWRSALYTPGMALVSDRPSRRAVAGARMGS